MKRSPLCADEGGCPWYQSGYGGGGNPPWARPAGSEPSDGPQWHIGGAYGPAAGEYELTARSPGKQQVLTCWQLDHKHAIGGVKPTALVGASPRFV
jgi:hypothetical protein